MRENTHNTRAQWGEETVQETPALHYTGLLDNPFSNSELRTSLRYERGVEVCAGRTPREGCREEAGIRRAGERVGRVAAASFAPVSIQPWRPVRLCPSTPATSVSMFWAVWTPRTSVPMSRVISQTKFENLHSLAGASVVRWCGSGPRTVPCRQRAAFDAFWTYPRPSYIFSSVVDSACAASWRLGFPEVVL